MSLIDLILLSIVMGIDCLIVSFAQGLIFKSDRKKNCLNLAATMGIFQGLMPIIGYIGADKMFNIISPYSRKIVFVLFLVLGLHFILDAIAPKKEVPAQCIGVKCLAALGLATSIDALISGVTIRLTSTSLALTVILFGGFSFVMSIIGFLGGNKIKFLPSKYLKIIGGIILIILAVK